MIFESVPNIIPLLKNDNDLKYFVSKPTFLFLIVWLQFSLALKESRKEEI